MNILCIGYYDKFSRFFICIKKENPNLKIKILSLYFSGYLYSILRLVPSSLLSFKAWINVFLNNKKYQKIINTHDSYKNIYLNNIVNFHTKLNKNISKKDLLLQAVSYIDILHKEFTTYKPDAVILIGDSRLSIEITKEIAKTLNVKIYFIEQGPFNTTFFDTKGVNANNSIRYIDLKKTKPLNKEQLMWVDSHKNKKKQEKYLRSPLYRGFDNLLTVLFEKTTFFPPDLKYSDTFPKLKLTKTNNQNLTSNIKIGKAKKYLLILQVPMDVNMIYHSPNFKNHYDIVKAIRDNLPKDAQLTVREHPIYKGKYEKKLYTYIQNRDIKFDTNSSLYDSLKNADVVIVNNSTVGIEAIALRKAVIVLADAYYDHPEICIKYNKSDNIEDILLNSIRFKPNDDLINTFLYKLFTEYTVQGFINDKNPNASNEIAKKII